MEETDSLKESDTPWETYIYIPYSDSEFNFSHEMPQNTGKMPAP